MIEGSASMTKSHCQPLKPPAPSRPSSAADTGEPSAEESGMAAMK